MGHFFRALNIIDFLEHKNIPFIILLNKNEIAESILKEKEILFETVDLSDTETDWETKLIQKYDIHVWINDRLNTIIQHAKNVKKNNIMLVTFDDKGSGAKLADYNIAALEFENSEILKGNKVLAGSDYLILNNEINNYKRIRKEIKKMVVTLGGSDTYGVTIQVIDILKKLNKPADIIIGPSFNHREALYNSIDQRFAIKFNVPSLVKEFFMYDLAITGGGITPFEANASGLPCIIIANEVHEIQVGKYLERLGSSIFAGYRANIDNNQFCKILNIEEMSRNGIKKLKNDAMEKIFKEIN